MCVCVYKHICIYISIYIIYILNNFTKKWFTFRPCKILNYNKIIINETSIKIKLFGSVLMFCLKGKYVGHLESKERLCIQPAQLFNFN